MQPTDERPDEAAWLGLAPVIDQLGTDRFERMLYEWTAKVGRISVLFAIEIFDDDRPGRVVVTEGRTEDLTRRARKISRDYATMDHAADDILNAHRADAPGRIDTLMQCGADRAPAFRVKYFDDMGAPQEVSGFSRTIASTLYVGISSSPAGYAQLEVHRLRSVLPVMLALVRRHIAAIDRRMAGRPNSERETVLRRMLLDQEPSLTAREAQICAAIVLGYGAEAAAARIGISPNTVATHRKRAYAKLHISSQTELFGLLFSGWDH